MSSILPPATSIDVQVGTLDPIRGAAGGADVARAGLVPGVPRHVHLLGAGGAGVSAAARVLLSRGHVVTGHDRAASPFTEVLAGLGLDLQLGDSVAEALPRQAEVVVRSVAVGLDDPQVVAAQGRGLAVLKYAELLGRLAPAGRTAAVAGTHGKTTTSWMVHHALAAGTGPRPGGIIGGLHQALRSNAVVPERGGWFTVEACEYDRSFLHLAPTAAIVTNVEPDHLDVYGDLATLEAAFCRFVDRVHPNGLVVLGREVPDRVAHATRARVWRLGRELSLDLHGERRGRFTFSLRGPGWATPRVTLSVPGAFNVENAALAIALAIGAHGVEPSRAAEAVAQFPGAGRRFEAWGAVGEVDVVHDYAHHPTEVRVTLEAARRAFPGRPLHVLFQPHQHSRTARFMEDFVEALRGADRVVVADVYGARRHIDLREGADAHTLVTRLSRARVAAEEGGGPEAACRAFVAGLAPNSAALVMGAGDIDGIRDDLFDHLALRFAR
ncbi:MAG: Mur ligase family protein [Planctomycetota bacterium]